MASLAASEGNLRICGLGKAANSASRILSAAWETEGEVGEGCDAGCEEVGFLEVEVVGG